MPFGLPGPQDQYLERLALSLGDNSADLERVAAAAMQHLNAVGAANATDLQRPIRAVNRRLNSVSADNSAELGHIAQTMALHFAAQSQANAADMAQLPPEMGQIESAPPLPLQSSPAQSATLGQCTFYVILLTPVGQWIVQRIDTRDEFAAVTAQQSGGVRGNIYVGAYRNITLAQHAADTLNSGQQWAIPPNPPYDNPDEILTPCDAPTQAPITPQPSSPTRLPTGLPRTVQPTGAMYWTCGVDASRSIAVHTYPDGQQAMLVDIDAFGPVDPDTVTFEDVPSAMAWLQVQPESAVCGGGTTQPTQQSQPQPSPQPQPQPSPPIIPRPFTPAPCQIGGCLQDGIGFPGTVQFCACLNQLPDAIQAIYESVVGWISGNLSVESIQLVVANYQPSGSITNPAGYVLDAIVEAIRPILRQASTFIDSAVTTLRCIVSISAQIRTAGNPELYVMLQTLKILLDSLKTWELGTDAIAWIVDRIELAFGPMESLLDNLINWSMPVEIPEAGEATRAWLQGQIDTAQRDCVWQMHGLNPGMYYQFAIAESEALTADEIVQIGYRRHYDDATMTAHLQQHGWQRDWDREAKLDLHWEIPTIGDHLHWLSRNVDDAAYVQQYGLLDGFAPIDEIQALGPWPDYHTVVDPHGRNFWRTYGDDLSNVGMRKINAAYHYAAHWIQPSPEQLREFIFRLRPGAPGMEVEFTATDYDRILAEQDYAPLARQWFVATAYNVPALSYVISMYRQGVIDEDRLGNYHQDLGYTADDSANFVGVDRLQKAQFRASRFAGWTPRAIAKAVALGTMQEADAVAKLTALGASNQEATEALQVGSTTLAQQIVTRARSRAITRAVTRVTKAIAVGVLDDPTAEQLLRNLGFPQSYSSSIVASELAARGTAIAAASVAAIRTRYIDGYIDQTGATQSLTDAGIQSDRINQLLSLWNLQNTPRRKHRTAKEIVADVANGYYDTASALSRLLNLGYDNADSMLFLADASGAIAQRNAKAAAAAQRDARTAAKQAQQLASQARSQARQLVAAAKHAAPKSTLIKWLRQGLISNNEFAMRMELQGYSPTDIQRYVDSATKDVTQSILEKWDKGSVISDTYYRYRLAQLGYAAEDIERFAAQAGTHQTPPVPGP